MRDRNSPAEVWARCLTDAQADADRLRLALDGLLQHLSEHPSNWPHGDYHSLMNAAEEAIGRDDD